MNTFVITPPSDINPSPEIQCVSSASGDEWQYIDNSKILESFKEIVDKFDLVSKDITTISNKLNYHRVSIQISHLDSEYILKQPLSVTVFEEDNIFLAEMVDINLYSDGSNFMNAIDNLKIELVSYFEELNEDEQILSEKLTKELIFLRTVIKSNEI